MALGTALLVRHARLMLPARAIATRTAGAVRWIVWRRPSPRGLRVTIGHVSRKETQDAVRLTMSPIWCRRSRSDSSGISCCSQRYYETLAIYRRDIIVPFGFLSMLIQAAIFAWIYDRCVRRRGEHAWLAQPCATVRSARCCRGALRRWPSQPRT